MLTPEELANITDTLHPQLDKLQAWITADLISRLMARLGRGELFLTETDKWQLQVFKDAGGHYDALQAQIKKHTKKTNEEIKAIFEDAAIRAWTADDNFYVAQGLESIPLLKAEGMVQIIADAYERTTGEVINFTRTTASTSQQHFIRVLDDAHFKVMTGAASYTQAVREAVNELISTQARVSYPTGHTDTIETAVLRAVRTGVAQAAGNIALQGMEQRGWDLVRVSAHLGARYGDGGENPGNHFWWQGKLYSRSGKSEKYPPFELTGYGTGEGLCGWNCRHSFGPGDPDRNPFQNFDAESNKKAFDLSQKQRKAEAQIRRQKLKVLGLHEAMDAAQDPELKAELTADYGKAAKRLTLYNQAYDKLCQDNGLKKFSDRVYIARWTRSEAAKATAAARKTL